MWVVYFKRLKEEIGIKLGKSKVSWLFAWKNNFKNTDIVVTRPTSNIF